MFKLFVEYNKATGYQKSMSHQAYKNSGLSQRDFVFIYDHYEELKKDYIVFMALMKVTDKMLNLKRYIPYRTEYYEYLLELVGK